MMDRLISERDEVHKKMQRAIEVCGADLGAKESRLGVVEGLILEREHELRAKDAELHNFHRDCEWKEEELRELSVRITDCKKELRVKEEELDSMQRLVDGEGKELEFKRRNLLKELESNKKEFDSFRRSIREKSAELEKKERKLGERVKDLESMKKQFEGRVKEFESKEKQYGGQGKELKAKERKFEERVKEFESKQKQFEVKVEGFESKEKQFEGRVKEIELREKQLEGQAKDLSSKENQFEGQAKELESQEKQFKGRVKELASKEKQFEGRVKEIELREKQFEGQAKELASQEKQFIGRMMELASKEKQFDGQAKELESKEKQFEGQVKELESKEKQLKGQLQELESKRKEFEEQVKEFDSKQKHFKGQMKQFETEQKQFRGQVKAHSSKEKKLESKEKQYDGQVQELKAKEKQFEVRAKELESKEKEFEEQVKDLESQKNQNIGQMKATELRKAMLNGQLEGHKSKENELEAQMKDLESKRNQYEEKLKELELKEKQLEAQMKDLESEWNQYEEKLKEIELIEAQFSVQLKDLQSKQNQLERQQKELELKEKQYESLRNSFEEGQVLKEKSNILLHQVKAEPQDFTDAGSVNNSKNLHLLSNLLKNYDLVCSQVSDALQTSSDPSIMVLDTIKGFCPPQLRQEPAECDANISRRVRNLLMDELKKCSPVFSSYVKQEAMKFASDWKASIAVADTDSLEVLDFLKFVATYEIGSSFNEHELQRLLDIISQHCQAPQALGNIEKLPDNQICPTTADGRNLQLLSNEPESIGNDILACLQTSADPATLALDIIQNPIVPRDRNGNEDVILDGSHIILLDQLMRISPSPFIKPHIRDAAKKLAVALKAKLNPSDENSSMVLGFLQLLSIYGLVSFFDEDEVYKLFEFVAQHKQAVELFQTLGFADKVSDFVQNLIEKQQYIEAVRFICAYKLTDKFDPVGLLRLEIVRANRLAGKHFSRKKPLEKKLRRKDIQIRILGNVLQCISDSNLESQGLVDEIQDRILSIEKKKEELFVLERQKEVLGHLVSKLSSTLEVHQGEKCALEASAENQLQQPVEKISADIAVTENQVKVQQPKGNSKRRSH
ncbi:uncharacterized protein LOC130747810 [Lotus japonicus]|uniref:uncharacterized protein LOC130747810 n=1 Tax=Lotus japonicus TaxID=34305 RepID=UPI00258C2EAB|nr:uncharacterized protein LOC130747810 [Lotus japonicus]